MRALRTLAVVAALTGLVLAARPALASQGAVEKHFAPGGRVRLDLSAGDYTIKAGRDDRILVAWQTRANDRGRAAIDLDKSERNATIVTDGSHNHFRVVVEVPALTDLEVDLSAGNVRVMGISGNKNIGSWAGNLDVQVPKPDEYSLIDLSVTAGDIRATGIGIRKGGLFRSCRWSGKGRYVLRVRLTAGNVRLMPA